MSHSCTTHLRLYQPHICLLSKVWTKKLPLWEWVTCNHVCTAFIELVLVLVLQCSYFRGGRDSGIACGEGSSHSWRGEDQQKSYNWEECERANERARAACSLLVSSRIFQSFCSNISLRSSPGLTHLLCTRANKDSETNLMWHFRQSSEKKRLEWSNFFQQTEEMTCGLSGVRHIITPSLPFSSQARLPVSFQTNYNPKEPQYSLSAPAQINLRGQQN